MIDFLSNLDDTAFAAVVMFGGLLAAIAYFGILIIAEVAWHAISRRIRR